MGLELRKQRHREKVNNDLHAWGACPECRLIVEVERLESILVECPPVA